MLTTDVPKFLGHRNLSTTTRYLNTTSRRLRLALLRVEQARAQSESLANSCKETPEIGPTRRRRRGVVHAEQVTVFLAAQRLVRKGDSNPHALRAPAPQAGASASSATSAKRGVCRSCYFGPVGPVGGLAGVVVAGAVDGAGVGVSGAFCGEPGTLDGGGGPPPLTIDPEPPLTHDRRAQARRA